MTAIYDKLGTRFLYPENWRVEEDNTGNDPRTVSLQSPSGGTWELFVYREARDLNELADAALETMREEYPAVEATARLERFAEVDAVGYEMFFYYLDLLINSRALAARLGDRTVLLLWQAEDRVFDELEPVFRAITTSLLNPNQFVPTE